MPRTKNTHLRRKPAARKRRPAAPHQPVSAQQTGEPMPALDKLIDRATADPNSLTPNQVMHLQRTIGNQAVQRLMLPGPTVTGGRVAPGDVQRTPDAVATAPPAARRTVEPARRPRADSIQREETDFGDMTATMAASWIAEGKAKVKEGWSDEGAPARIGKIAGKIGGSILSIPVAILMGAFQVPEDKANAIIDAFIAQGGTVGKFIGKTIGGGAAVLKEIAGAIGAGAGFLVGGGLGALGAAMGKPKRGDISQGDIVEGGAVGGAMLGRWAARLAVATAFSPVTATWDLLKHVFTIPSQYREHKAKLGRFYAVMRTLVNTAKAVASLAAALTLLFTILSIFPFGQPLLSVIPIVGWFAFMGAAVQTLLSVILRIGLAKIGKSATEDQQRDLKAAKKLANIDILSGILGTFLAGFVPATAGGATGLAVGAVPVTAAEMSGAAIGGEAVDLTLGKMTDKATRPRGNAVSMKRADAPMVVQRADDEETLDSTDDPAELSAKLDEMLDRAQTMQTDAGELKADASHERGELVENSTAISATKAHLAENPELTGGLGAEEKLSEAESGLSSTEGSLNEYGESEEKITSPEDEGQIKTDEARLNVVEEYAERDPESITKDEADTAREKVASVRVEPKKEKWYKRAGASFRKFIRKLFGKMVSVKQRAGRIIAKIRAYMMQLGSKIFGLEKPLQEMDESMTGAQEAMPQETEHLEKKVETAEQAEDDMGTFVTAVRDAKREVTAEES